MGSFYSQNGDPAGTAIPLPPTWRKKKSNKQKTKPTTNHLMQAWEKEYSLEIRTEAAGVCGG